MSSSWQEIERLFHEALACPDAERQAFLEASCGKDHELLKEVESLLRHHGAPTGSLATPLHPVAADLLTMVGDRDEPPAGATFGPYQIEHRLGHGGMGSVHLATDTRLNRRVAIKLIGRSFAHTPAARARFLREARSAAALAHPNIAVVFDCGETAGCPWLVMEYIAGTSLRSRLLAGPVTEGGLLDYATQIASALEHAHARRIVHRDIKPENIMLTEDGVVKLVDFGLARAVAEEAAAGKPITKAGVFLGTLAYTAPELFSGAAASPRSDVYSLGVVLCEMALGQHPFANLSGPALVGAIVGGQQPVGESLDAAVSPAVRALIQRCMSRDPSTRYADGSAVSAALRTIRGGGSIAPLAPQVPRVAILDFANIAGPADLDWLGTGIAETLSADLTQLKSVTVANRGRVQQAVRRAGHSPDDAFAAAALGRELAVEWIVTGTLQQLGNRIRLTPKLIETASGELIAIGKIDGVRDEIFDLQDRVAEALMHHLSLRTGAFFSQKPPAAKPSILLAYEHYIRGRQQMYLMQGQALTTAIQHFNQAVQLDPEYALAFSGLGTAHALQFLRTSDPADVARSSEYLERAIQLDSELGEPYPWLCNIRVRQNNPEGAFAAGAKGIQLQPDLAEAHYFYGGIHYMLAECGYAGAARGLQRFREAIRLQPKFHPAWVMSGALSIFVGRHQNAIELLSKAVQLEQEPDLLYRFEGARTLSGIAFTRLGDWEKGRQQHNNALQMLNQSDHIYRDTFRILSACGLGDIELRAGSGEAALAHYRQAWQIGRERPRIAGIARLQIRAGAGLAAAYARMGERDRARKLIDEALRRLETVRGQTATMTIECGFGQLCLDIGVAELQLENRQEAVSQLERAREAGWKDLAWLRTDPAWRPLHEDPVLVSWLVAPSSSGGS